MQSENFLFSDFLKIYTVAGLITVAIIFTTVMVFADTSSTSVSVANATPSVSAAAISTSTIVLTENATTSVTITATITDTNGCDTVFASGTITGVFYRSGVTGTSSCTASDVNCYRNLTFVEVGNTCTGGADTTGDTVATASVWYFADATDASSSFSAQNWIALVKGTDFPAATSSESGASSTAEMSTLVALNVTASISYGSVSAGQDTGSTNQVATSTNTGNAKLDLEISGANMVSGGNSIDVAQQKYGSSTAAYSSLTYSLSTTPTARNWNVGIATASGTASASSTFWGTAVPSGQANGSYTGTTTLTAIWSAD